MPRLTMFPTFIREIIMRGDRVREPEPALIMADEDQVKAYSEAGRIDGVMSAAYLFHTARISAVIRGKKNVLDLGCGPATQLGQVAQLNPEIQFTGVDLSETMLKDAQEHVKNLDITNVSFVHGDVTNLEQFESGSFDAVITTMALHHLPSLDLLERCFLEIQRVLSPGGAVYLADFGRLKSLKSIIFFAYLNERHQPHIFSLDYERSLRAAFSLSDFQDLAKKVFIDNLRVLSTFGMPVLVLLKTPDVALDQSVVAKLKAMRKQLPTKYRRELDDIRLFFWLSGLKNDPF
jgi:arsenite methyltransferase